MSINYNNNVIIACTEYAYCRISVRHEHEHEVRESSWGQC